MGSQKPKLKHYNYHGENKGTQWQAMIDKILHRKLKIEQQESYKYSGGIGRYSGNASSSCSISGTRHVTLKHHFKF